MCGSYNFDRSAVTPAQSPGELLSAHNKVISVWVLQIKYYICKVINK